ncbi:HNH endonuclease signature motif containing protein [Capnocytophaga canimorsus]|uniref:HNH endonuclease signature motif containing protein n=1 Tax=Capnocytophaga canimorsus TaxID=28188 RepID=UPI0037CEA0E4
MKRTFWTSEMDTLIKKMYPNTSSAEIAQQLNVTTNAVYKRAFALGLKKSKAFISQTAKRNIQNNENAKKTQFKKGCISSNKGKKQSEFLSPEAIEKVRATQFKKGHIPHNTKYDGYERISKYGYIEVRVSMGKYVLKHRKIWQEHYGEIPKGNIIIFKDNNPLNCDIDNLEMITKDENAIRNRWCANYPREIQQAEYTRVKLQRKIKEYGTKQN